MALANVRRAIPSPIRRAIRGTRRALRRTWRRTSVLGRVRPMSDVYGADRGTPIDRVFIRRFLERHRDDVRGRVLEVGWAEYTHALGGDRVATCTIVDVAAEAQPGVLVADLSEPDCLPSEAFDCFILAQTMQYLPDPVVAFRNVWSCLAPGGVALVTAPALSRIEPHRRWPEYWRFTPLGLEHALRAAGDWAEFEVEGPGNVLAGAAFLYGLAAEEIPRSAFSHQDEAFPLVACARAVKPVGEARAPVVSEDPRGS